MTSQRRGDGGLRAPRTARLSVEGGWNTAKCTECEHADRESGAGAREMVIRLHAAHWEQEHGEVESA